MYSNNPPPKSLHSGEFVLDVVYCIRRVGYSLGCRIDSDNQDINGETQHNNLLRGLGRQTVLHSEDRSS